MYIDYTRNTYGVDILVNGKPTRQYLHDGKVFIEAKEGTEYVIRIHNNSYGRILALSSVDGLSVMSGKTAVVFDSGYVIDGYNDLKIKGFRYNTNEVAAFKFARKEKSYAASKGNGSEANCGIIGIKLFNEYIPAPPVATYLRSSDNEQTRGLMLGNVTKGRGIARGQTKSIYCLGTPSLPANNLSFSADSLADEKERGYDMGSEWGKAVNSPTVKVEFNKGQEVFSLDIRYASRESLLEMGVPLVSKMKTAEPQSFPGYAQPPAGWPRV